MGKGWSEKMKYGYGFSTGKVREVYQEDYNLKINWCLKIWCKISNFSKPTIFFPLLKPKKYICRICLLFPIKNIVKNSVLISLHSPPNHKIHVKYQWLIREGCYEKIGSFFQHFRNENNNKQKAQELIITKYFFWYSNIALKCGVILEVYVWL